MILRALIVAFAVVAGAVGSAATSDADPTPTSDVYYPNCKAARQAGVAPLQRGDPGYRPGLDRDNDGIACE